MEDDLSLLKEHAPSASGDRFDVLLFHTFEKRVVVPFRVHRRAICSWLSFWHLSPWRGYCGVRLNI
jgi:hypothetical protein